jgi:hypothetical protein
MSELKKDIFISGLFMGGIFGFVSGAYVVSSALFVTVAVVNNLHYSYREIEGV